MKREVFLIGVGMGSSENLTVEAETAIRQSDLLIGAKRMLRPFSQMGKKLFVSYRPEEIADFLRSDAGVFPAAVLLSGDVGFYSNAKRLSAALEEWEVKQIAGISSLSYFCSKLGCAWDEVYPLSLHHHAKSCLGAVSYHAKTFLLLGGKISTADVCRELTAVGLDEAKVFVGENLSYPNEKIICGAARELCEIPSENLTVLLVENPHYQPARYRFGIPDERFIRGKTPMTKSEVRAVSMAKLAIVPDDIVYDIGAGTGSVAVEAAFLASAGEVYAVEQNADAAALIAQNRRQFGTYNLHILQGRAPALLEGNLPIPDKVFIGGSGGSLEEIFAVLFQKNPKVRIVVNAIAVETLAQAQNCFQKYDIQPEIVQLSVAKAKSVGNYQMMMGQNPVWIISGEAKPPKD